MPPDRDHDVQPRGRLTDEIERLERHARVDRDTIDALVADGIVDQAKIANLEIALTSCRRIGAAVGIIMATQRITEDAAFDVLRAVSQQQNRKLREVADDVLWQGDLT